MVKAGALEYTIEADTKDFVQGITATKKELRDAKRAMRETLTPAEKYGQKIEKLERLHKKGLLTSEQYKRAVDKEKQALDRASMSNKKATGTFGNLSASVKQAASAFIGLSIAQRSLAMIRGELERLDELAKTSRKLGLGANELQALQLAAEETAGVMGTQFNQSLQRMTRRISEATAGTGEAQKAIEELGLSAAVLNSMGPDKAFRTLAEAIQDVSSQQDRLRISVKLFDQEGASLVNTLNIGKEGLDEYTASAQELMGTFSDEELAQVEAANDAFGRLEKTLRSIATVMAVDLAPEFKQTSDLLGPLVKGINTIQSSPLFVNPLNVSQRALGLGRGIGEQLGIVSPEAAPSSRSGPSVDFAGAIQSTIEQTNQEAMKAQAVAKEKELQAAETMNQEMLNGFLAGIPRAFGEELGGPAGKITGALKEVFGAGAAAIGEKLQKSSKPLKVEFPSSAQRGSREEFDLIRRITANQANDEVRRHKEAQEARNQQAGFLERVADAVEDLGTVAGVSS